MQFLLFIAILLALAAVGCNSTEVRQCKSGVPLPYRVNVKGCEKSPCEFVKGSKAEWEMIFDAPNDLNSFQPKVVATFLGIPAEYPLPEKEGCNELIGTKCPLEEGQRVVYSSGLQLESWFPLVTVKIEKTLYTDDEEGVNFPFTCFQIDVKVKAG